MAVDNLHRRSGGVGLLLEDTHIPEFRVTLLQQFVDGGFLKSAELLRDGVLEIFSGLRWVAMGAAGGFWNDAID